MLVGNTNKWGNIIKVLNKNPAPGWTQAQILVIMCVMIWLKSDEISVISMVKSTENPSFKIHIQFFGIGSSLIISNNNN